MAQSTNGGDRRVLPGAAVAVVAAALGATIAFVLALLTFGVQATAGPHELPLAIGTTDAASASALAPIISRITAQGGDAVSWQTVDSRERAENLLDSKQVYGAVLFSPGPNGLKATVLVSGAINPTATAVAQPLLTQVGVAVTSLAQSPGNANTAAAPAVQVETLHPTSAAGRTIPLAGSALLWLAALVANVFILAAAPRLRRGKPAGVATTVGAAVVAAFAGTGVVLLLARLWDSTLSLDWEVIGFLFLVGAAFAFLQAGVLRWLGLAGMALLGPFYLMAPAVAGQVPELLNPTYRAVLWSWTPFRFSAEATRSLMLLGPGGPDIQNAILIFAGLALVGLVLLVAPKPMPRRAPAT